VKKQHIQQFDLSPSAKAGVFVINIQEIELKDEHDIFEPHRDKHYLLLIATHGHYKMMLDFKELVVDAPVMLLISPGQVHHILEMQQPHGWSVNFDPSLISETFQRVLEKGFATPLLPDPALLKQMTTLAALVCELQSGEQDAYTGRSTHELLAAILSIIAGKFSQSSAGNKIKENRSSIIEQDFNKLLQLHYKTWKQPALYAGALSISVAHLNESVKNISGFPVSVQIQQKSVLEAKRLLYFTKLSVKEIGYELGYDNPVYFSKLFKKITSFTPLEFREQYHD
jgi:AraC family transcriptional activator of pobA